MIDEDKGCDCCKEIREAEAVWGWMQFPLPPEETPEQRAKRELGFPIEGVEP